MIFFKKVFLLSYNSHTIKSILFKVHKSVIFWTLTDCVTIITFQNIFSHPRKKKNLYSPFPPPSNAWKWDMVAFEQSLLFTKITGIVRKPSGLFPTIMSFWKEIYIFLQKLLCILKINMHSGATCYSYYTR